MEQSKTKKPLPKIPFLISKYPIIFIISQVCASIATMAASNYIDNPLVGMIVSFIMCLGFFILWYREAASRYRNSEKTVQNGF